MYRDRELTVIALALTLIASTPAKPAVLDRSAGTIASTLLGPKSLIVPGTPIQTQETPVLVSSCNLEYKKPPGASGQVAIYHYAIYNQSGRTLQYVALTDRFDDANFQEAFVSNLKPGEFREIRMVRDENSAVVAVQLLHRPTFFLCGSGPDQDDSGAILPYSSLALRRLQIDRLLIPMVAGKFQSPFETVSSQILTQGSKFVPGAALQPQAAVEQSTYTPGVPPRNAVPFIMESCSLMLNDRDSGRPSYARATLYNQTVNEFRFVTLSVRAADGTWQSSANATDVRPHEYRTVTWPVPRESPVRRPRLVLCSIGPSADGQ